MSNRYDLAQKLIGDYPTKAAELLVDYLKDDDTRAATERYIGQNPIPQKLERPPQHQRGPLTSRSHHRTSYQQQGSASHDISNVRHSLNTPPTSAGSVKSHTSGLAAAGMEKITFLLCDDEGTDQAVIARRGGGKHNLIGDEVAYGRGLSAGQFEVDESIPVHLSSGGQRWINVKYAVNRTWRRTNEFKTRLGTFYIVPGTCLDSDVVLGSDESQEHQLPPDVQEVHSSEVHYPPTFARLEKMDPAVLPRAPTVPLHPYQQQTCLPIQRTYDLANDIRESQHMPAAEPPTATAPTRHIDHVRSTQAPTTLTSKDPSSGLLQVQGLWDKTPIKMSFDPDAPGEEFYQAFHQWAVKRKRDGDLQRQIMTLFLKTTKATPDEEAYELGLKEGELEELWESAVEWIQENKNPNVPHLYATVELESG